jgi:hypothetical protein
MYSLLTSLTLVMVKMINNLSEYKTFKRVKFNFGGILLTLTYEMTHYHRLNPECASSYC